MGADNGNGCSPPQISTSTSLAGFHQGGNPWGLFVPSCSVGQVRITLIPKSLCADDVTTSLLGAQMYLSVSSSSSPFSSSLSTAHGVPLAGCWKPLSHVDGWIDLAMIAVWEFPGDNDGVSEILRVLTIKFASFWLP